MPTQCSAERSDFGMAEGRVVEAAFDAGLVTSDAGGLLLGAADRAIDLVERFAACFRDHRRQDLIEHAVTTLVGQRVFGIALGYEDLNDHDQLRHDPVLAVLAGKLSSTCETCGPVAGKSTLNPAKSLVRSTRGSCPRSSIFLSRVTSGPRGWRNVLRAVASHERRNAQQVSLALPACIQAGNETIWLAGISIANPAGPHAPSPSVETACAALLLLIT